MITYYFNNYTHKLTMKLLESNIIISEELRYHIDNDMPLYNNIYRYGSDFHLKLIQECRKLVENHKLVLENPFDDFIVSETNMGMFGIYENEYVPLDLPLLNENKVELNKPKRGGSKKFYVYVKDPKTKNVKKIEFGAKDGGQNLRVKFKDKEARNAFANRHNCKNKKDKTKAGYWSCNLPKYAEMLGLGKNMNTYW